MGNKERVTFRSSKQTCSIAIQKTKSNKVPWITNKVTCLITTRNKLKRKAILSKTETDCSNYKKIRNQVDIDLRNAKKNYYSSIKNLIHSNNINIRLELASQIQTSTSNFETYVKKAPSEFVAFQCLSAIEQTIHQ